MMGKERMEGGRQRMKETDREREKTWCWNWQDEKWTYSRVRERERLSEGVPLPSVQPPTLTSQTERHKTSRSQLSSSLDSSHTLRSTFTLALRHLLWHLLSPELGPRMIIIISPTQHCTPATRKPLGLSLLRTEACSVSCEWRLVLCEAADGSTRARELGSPQPCPQKAADVTEEERRRKKHNLPDPSFPHLGEQYPASSWIGSAFVSLPTLPLKSQEQTDAVTHWPAAVRGEDGATTVAALFMQFDSVLGQLLCDSQPVSACFHECVESTGLVWTKCRCSPRVHSSLAPAAPLCLWDRRAALPASSSWKRSSSLRSFGRGLSRLWLPRDRRASSSPASPPARGWPSELPTF